MPLTLSGKALAAGIAASQTDQEPAASALPLTYFSNGAYSLWTRLTPAWISRLQCLQMEAGESRTIRHPAGPNRGNRLRRDMKPQSFT
jgi:hypothetical protein